MPWDDPLAALEVIEKRCRDLSANQHLTSTSTTDSKTSLKHRAARVEAMSSDGDDNDNHHETQVYNLFEVGLFSFLISFPKYSSLAGVFSMTNFRNRLNVLKKLFPVQRSS